MKHRVWSVLLLSFIATAQQPAQNPQTTDEGIVTFRSSAQLVIEAVTVIDRKGRPLEGLSAKDFTITEDGIPQAISFCEFQKLRDAPPLPVDKSPGQERPMVDPVAQTGIASEQPGDVKYRDRRLLVLYFDMSAMPPADQLRAHTAAVEFITNRMTPTDLVAIISFSDVVRVRQDFTDDRDHLLMVINKLFLNKGWQWLGGRANDDSAADYGSAFGEDDSEFYLFTTDRQLAALETAVQMLAKVNQKKALIYFASGLRLNGISNQAQLAATINAAIRANVSLFTIDARGLVATPPLGDASQGSQGGLAMYTGSSAMSVASQLQHSQDTLYALAADTGGKALVDNNDLVLGIVNAQKAVTSYYILGYYTANPALDGRLRRIRITYKDDRSAKLDYRQGYYAGKQFSRFTTAEKERQLQDALALGDPITEITIAAEVDYFQLNSAEYFVPVAIKIPGSELVLAQHDGAERTTIDFIGEVKDEYKVTLANVRDKVDIKLDGETAAQLAKRHIQYDTGFTLLPGTYTLKLLARNNETGRIGTYLTIFVVPNLNKEQQRNPISSVILSAQRMDLKEALYSINKNKNPAINPLMQHGLKLIPSVTRAFSRSRDMYVYLQAYRIAASPSQPLLAFVTFYRGQTKAMETGLLAVTDALESRLRTAPLFFGLSLDKLRPGNYTCQVSVVDPASQRTTFWQAPIMLVP